VNRWRVVFTKQVQKDAKKLASSGLRPKAAKLLSLLAENPFRRRRPTRSSSATSPAPTLAGSTFSIGWCTGWSHSS